MLRAAGGAAAATTTTTNLGGSGNSTCKRPHKKVRIEGSETSTAFVYSCTETKMQEQEKSIQKTEQEEEERRRKLGFGSRNEQNANMNNTNINNNAAFASSGDTSAASATAISPVIMTITPRCCYDAELKTVIGESGQKYVLDYVDQIQHAEDGAHGILRIARRQSDGKEVAIKEIVASKQPGRFPPHEQRSLSFSGFADLAPPLSFANMGIHGDDEWEVLVAGTEEYYPPLCTAGKNCKCGNSSLEKSSCNPSNGVCDDFGVEHVWILRRRMNCCINNNNNNMNHFHHHHHHNHHGCHNNHHSQDQPHVNNNNNNNSNSTVSNSSSSNNTSSSSTNIGGSNENDAKAKNNTNNVDKNVVENEKNNSNKTTESSGKISICINNNKNEMNNNNNHNHNHNNSPLLHHLVHINHNNSVVIACYKDASSQGCIREMTLPMCLKIWGGGKQQVKSVSFEDIFFASPLDEPKNLSPKEKEQTVTSPSRSNKMEPLLPLQEQQQPTPTTTTSTTTTPTGDQPKRQLPIPTRLERFRRVVRAASMEISALKSLRMQQKNSTTTPPPFLASSVVNAVDVCFHVFDWHLRIFLVMPRAKGDVMDLLSSEIYQHSEENARLMFEKLVRGVQAAHLCGWAHRDIKLENILIGSPSIRQQLEQVISPSAKKNKSKSKKNSNKNRRSKSRAGGAASAAAAAATETSSWSCDNVDAALAELCSDCGGFKKKDLEENNEDASADSSSFARTSSNSGKTKKLSSRLEAFILSTAAAAAAAATNPDLINEEFLKQLQAARDRLRREEETLPQALQRSNSSSSSTSSTSDSSSSSSDSSSSCDSFENSQDNPFGSTESAVMMAAMREACGLDPSSSSSHYACSCDDEDESDDEEIDGDDEDDDENNSNNNPPAEVNHPPPPPLQSLPPHQHQQQADFELWLADFGLSTNQSIVSDPVGSPPIRAPETFLLQPYDAKTADIWSLGVVLFQLIARTQVYWLNPMNRPVALREARNEDAGFLLLRYGRARFDPARFSPLVSDLILRLLRINPSERLSLDQILEHPWMQKPETHTSE